MFRRRGTVDIRPAAIRPASALHVLIPCVVHVRPPAKPALRGGLGELRVLLEEYRGRLKIQPPAVMPCGKVDTQSRSATSTFRRNHETVPGAWHPGRARARPAAARAALGSASSRRADGVSSVGSTAATPWTPASAGRFLRTSRCRSTATTLVTISTCCARDAGRRLSYYGVGARLKMQDDMMGTAMQQRRRCPVRCALPGRHD
jgi:hypothetical protein